jgi:2-amino-4-hydroxy-6-hydroxymethyldihydropteridine diphosphokinase
MNKNIAFIGLGTNIGIREQNLQNAIALLNDDEHIFVKKLSSIYETDPIGYVEQEAFLNMVIKIETTYTPFELIDVTMEIEAKLGRERKVHWGPRTIDLDILLYNQENIESEQLIVPHPRMKERAFVIIPLLELVGDVMVDNHSLKGELGKLHDKEGVRLWKRETGAEGFEHSEN